MLLAAGSRLGAYEVVRLIGAGGMGEVYQARDERLQRPVAIKVLAGDSSPDEHARLLSEARAASALNHPNICTVHEVGEAAGRAFIVMEFVEGRPLSQMVPHDGLPPETVTRFGMQLASALGHAHDRGIIHRDLKTANVVVNTQGAPKILDFGLARSVVAAASEATTARVVVTEAGSFIGTLAYLPPEALLGQPVDARSDIWSLGVVLYEIATGSLPFSGRNTFELTAAILRESAARFPAHVPPALRTVITRCLAKEPVERYQHAGEVRAALEAIGSDIASLTAVAPGRQTRARVLAALTIMSLAAAAGASFLLRDREPDWKQFAAERRLTRLSASSDKTATPALSPDGRMLCYAQQTADGRTDLYVGRIAGGARVRLTNDDAIEEDPKFSPDGDMVAFTRVQGADGVAEVRVLPSLGGDIVSTIPRAANATWSPDGRRLAYVRQNESGALALVISGVDGLEPSVILAADSVYPRLQNPAWSPDGRHVTVVRSTGGAAGELWLVPVDAGAPRRLLNEPASTFSDFPAFTRDGRGIVHASNRGGSTNLWLLPVRGGTPVRLTTGPGPDESPTVADDGSIAFLNSRWRDLLQVFDAVTGVRRTLLTHTPYLWGPAISPDGQEIAFTRSEVDGAWHIWSVPLAGGTAKRLTSTDAGELYPRWSPDSAYVWFHTWNQPRRFGRVPRNGGPVEWMSLGGESHDGYAAPSPDGTQIAFVRADEQTERIYIERATGGAPRLLTSSPGSVPAWSPDGSRIAFSRDRQVSGGIFVVNADGSGQRQLTKEGGWPVWWPDGSRIGYLALDAAGNQQIRVVPAAGGTPIPLAQVRLVGVNHPFAVSPDGRSIVVGNSEHVSDEIWLLHRK
jgi:Tol biopolymer transport system component/predicted Ser/Thr protein kinase